MALKIEKLKAPLFPAPMGPGLQMTGAFWALIFVIRFTSRKHLRTKVTQDFNLTYNKMGEIWGWYQND